MYSILFAHIKEYKKYALLSPFFVIIEVAMDIAIPYLMSLIIDRGIVGGSKEELLHIGGLLILAVIIAFISGLSSGYFATKASAGLARNLRYAMFQNIETFSFHNIDSFSAGSLVTRMTTDVQNLQMAFQMSIRIAIRSPLMLIFAFFMSMRINRALAMHFFFIIPILAIGMSLIISRAHPIYHKVFRVNDRLNTYVSENLAGIRVVKSFIQEENAKKEFGSISQSLYTLYRRAGLLLAFTMPLMQVSVFSLALIISWMGAKFIILGNLTTGSLISLLTYAFQIQISLLILSMIMVQLTIARNASERVSEVLSTKSDIVSPPHGICEMKDGSIEFDQVSFSYNRTDKNALQNINLNISSGDYVGIIGPTGSSKTTLIHLLPRLYDATKGSVKISGIDVKDYDLKFLRDKVSVVLQKNQLFTGTIMGNLRWGNKKASREEVVHAAKIACAHDFIMSQGGYESKVEREGTNFSGGQRQRLCIARALLKSPNILILDDSTSALDNRTESQIVEALKEHMPNMTKIMISQRIHSLKNCDYIIVMDKGKIESVGTHEQLLANSAIYQEIAQSQKQGGEEVERILQ